ncbi:cytochrome P450 3A19-like [Chironomus tepperi]|uniref:cytochrome P450 3A19-like n=1 Tax=Chironomus tepperi TaxID=113505 RepID=UPI00391F447F
MTELYKNIDDIINFCLKYKAKVTEIYNKKKVEDYDSIKYRVIDVLLNPENDLSDIEIRDELMLFTIGSYDTTAKTVSILILLTAIYPEIQKKLIEEIDIICEDEQNITFNMDFLKKFVYMEMVIKEVMRLFPTGPSVARTNDAEIEVGGYLVPKDSIFLISLMNMHRNPKYWGHDAHLFKPERFAEELKNPRIFAPFTGGKRLCIGYRYANMFMKILLINFFRSFQVKTYLKFEDIKVVMGVTLVMDQECIVTVEKRNK